MKIQGRAVVAGLPGLVTHAGITSGGKALLTGLDATHSWDVYETIEDPSTGEPIGEVIGKERYDLTIDFIPSADTAVANTLANAVKSLPFPSVNAIVTLSSMSYTALNDTYIYVGGGSQTYTPKGAVKWKLPIRRYVALDDAGHTSLATEVSA